MIFDYKWRLLYKNKHSLKQRAKFHGLFFEKTPDVVKVNYGKKADKSVMVPELATTMMMEEGLTEFLIKCLSSDIETIMPIGMKMIAIIKDSNGIERRFKETFADEHKMIEVLKQGEINKVHVRIIMYQDALRCRVPMDFDFLPEHYHHEGF